MCFLEKGSKRANVSTQTMKKKRQYGGPTEGKPSEGKRQEVVMIRIIYVWKEARGRISREIEEKFVGSSQTLQITRNLK